MKKIFLTTINVGFQFAAIVFALGFFTLSAFGQCQGNYQCSCYPGYTYTTGSVDYDSQQVVATGVTSGAYSSCGHTYSVTVMMSSPDGRQSSYQTGFSSGGYASGSLWMSVADNDGDYSVTTLHREWCYILGTAFVAAVTHQTVQVDPTITFQSFACTLNRIKKDETSNCVAMIHATSGASGVTINYESERGVDTGTIVSKMVDNPNAADGQKQLVRGDNSITPWAITDTSNPINDPPSQFRPNNNGTMNFNFTFSGPTSVNGKTIRYHGNLYNRETNLRVKSDGNFDG